MVSESNQRINRDSGQFGPAEVEERREQAPAASGALSACSPIAASQAMPRPRHRQESPHSIDEARNVEEKAHQYRYLAEKRAVAAPVDNGPGVFRKLQRKLQAKRICLGSR